MTPVSTYNAGRYAKEDGQVEIDANGKRLTLKRQTHELLGGQFGTSSRERTATLHIGIDGIAKLLSAQCSNQEPVQLKLRAEIDGKPALYLTNGDTRISIDEATELLTTGFLFEYGFSIKPH